MSVQSAPSATSAPSVTIAPRRIAGRLVFYVTILSGAGPATYPCRSEQAAFKLATRFVHAASLAATRTQAPEPEFNPYLYNGPPRTAEQVAA